MLMTSKKHLAWFRVMTALTKIVYGGANSTNLGIKLRCRSRELDRAAPASLAREGIGPQAEAIPASIISIIATVHGPSALAFFTLAPDL